MASPNPKVSTVPQGGPGATSTLPPIRVGLIGLGTVGSGVVEVLTRNREEIRRRAGRDIEVVHVAVRDAGRARQVLADLAPHIPVTTDPYDVVRNPQVDVVAEVMGGTTLARSLVLEAIAAGRHVVTANKALLAVHGNEVFDAAIRHGVMVAFEAAVAGGIPIIKALREGLTANRIESLAGIINGTTNYILTEMRNRGLAFAEALADAQRLGYAEADPAFDIGGIDAAHKAALLASIAFGIPVQFSSAVIEGIEGLAAADFVWAEKLGYRIKLLAIARRREEGIELRVHPTLIPARRLLANVDGPMNAIWVKGDAVGQTLYYGQGAGKLPTASAVVADLVDVARMLTADPQQRVPHLAFQHDALADSPILPASAIRSSYYLRMQVADEPGVLADITRILADQQVSIDAILQREPGEDETSTDVVLLTHRTDERRIDAAIARIVALGSVRTGLTRLRVEQLD